MKLANYTRREEKMKKKEDYAASIIQSKEIDAQEVTIRFDNLAVANTDFHAVVTDLF